MKKRLLSILLTLCMALSLLPAVAFAEGGAKAIQSGTGSIHGYDTSAGGYSYIYYGTWRNSPIKWRVLDTKANTGAADALFLLTDECLYPLPGDLYACYIQFNPADKQNRHLWKDSTLQNWFQNTFYSGENSAFTSAERALIPATTQEGSMYTLSNLHMRLQICALEAEYVFAPSIQDIMNADYGFTDAASRIAGPINSLGPGTRYWLRSFEISEQLPFMVGEDASLMGDWGDNPSAVRPAMNLSTAGNNILFVSAAEGGKPAGGLAEISEYTGNEWKLTLLDSSRSGFAVTTTDLSAYTRGGTVKIAYTGAKTGTNEYVSAMILDAAGNPAYYGRSSAALTDENGTAELTIPALAEGTYTLKVFNEQYNGDKMTDLASAFADVTLTVEEGVEEQFTLTPGGRYYFDLSAMNIPGTANRDLPDSTLHYVPFTYVGTVNAYKLTSAMATTEEYAQQNKYAHSLFVADYAVTLKVNWNNLDTASLIFGKNYASGGVDYTLRAPSVGSGFTGSDDSERGTPQSNEWDAVLDKNSGYVKNWNDIYSWGQDTSSYESWYRAVRGSNSARYWSNGYASTSHPLVGFRPVLEVLNPGTLGADGLKAVTLDLGGGKLGNSSEDIQIIVKTGSDFTAPASDDLTRPDGDTGNFFMWRGSNGKFYAPGAIVPAEVTKLTVQWTAPTYAVTLNTNGGTIADGKDVTGYTYGVGATLPTDVTRTGYTFKGWYDNEGLTGDPVTAIGGTGTGNKEYWAKWEINQYTITVKPENGKADITITQDYGTAITAPEAPTREGYTFMGWDREIPTTMPAENITLKARWKDSEKPTGEIVIGTNKWQEFLNKITFGLFFKDTQEVTINAADNSGTVFISYLVTDRDLSEAELQSLVFSGYEEPFRIDRNGEYIVYAMLVDANLNITYLRSDRVTVDNVQPVIGGIENGKTYCEAQTVTIDEKYVDTVTVNGTEVTLDENNSFILSPADGEQKIIVTDKAGNTAEMTVTVNDGHTGGTATCTEKAVCEVCGKAFGDLDGNHHANLKHIDAKAATKTAGGNIEYWYCEDCGKYFADAAATKEIKQVDTVTAKLSGAAKSPQTGGDSGVVTVLLLSGGAFICLVSCRKKRTHTV